MKVYEEKACIFQLLMFKILSQHYKFCYSKLSNVKIEPAFPIFYVQKIGNADPPFSNFKLLFFRHDVVECYHFQILNFCFSDMMLWNAQLLVWFRM